MRRSRKGPPLKTTLKWCEGFQVCLQWRKPELRSALSEALSSSIRGPTRHARLPSACAQVIDRLHVTLKFCSDALDQLPGYLG